MNVIVTLIMILLFFFQGRLFEVLKRIISLVIEVIFKFLNLLGIKIIRSEPKLKTSKQFKNAFEGIRVVKESKENIKLKPSVNVPALIIFGISLIIIIINLKYSLITDWLYSITWIQSMFHSEQSVDTMITAIAFSFISLSLSSLLQQWKETKKYRKAKKEMRERNKIVMGMSSKDLLTLAKNKDQKILEETLKKEIDYKENVIDD